MKNRDYVPLLVAGFLCGLAAANLSMFRDLVAGDILNGGITFAVGWWIQRSLGRQAEMGRIPIGTVSRLCDRIEGIVGECLDLSRRTAPASIATTNLIAALRQIANEISWLEMISRALETSTENVDKLGRQYIKFKGALTDSSLDLDRAAAVARDIRTSCLVIQWQMCEAVLNNPSGIDSLSDTEGAPAEHSRLTG